jgi:hypothetical protein
MKFVGKLRSSFFVCVSGGLAAMYLRVAVCKRVLDVVLQEAMEWATKLGLRVSPSLQQVLRPDGVRGVFATDALKQGTVIARIPVHTCVSYNLVKETPVFDRIYKALLLDGKEALFRITAGKIQLAVPQVSASLACFLAEQRARGPLKDYLQSIIVEKENAGSALRSALAPDEVELYDDFVRATRIVGDSIFERASKVRCLSSEISKEDIRWAHTVLESRIISLNDEVFGGGVLVPWLDMLNHIPVSNVMYTTARDSKEASTFSVVVAAATDVNPGDEIGFQYRDGGKVAPTRIDWACRFGFIPDDYGGQ